MKILFIVQGEGRGHMTQALSMEQLLKKNGHTIVEILVGKSKSRELPKFFIEKSGAPISQFESPNFQPSQSNQGVDMVKSIAYNVLRTPVYWQSMRYIHQKIKSTQCDLVINFYEIVAGLTYFFYRPRVPQICIGHQYIFLHEKFHIPKTLRSKIQTLNFYSQLTALGATEKLALSFHSLPESTRKHIKVVPPLLRKEIRQLESKNGNYIHGYMLNAGFSNNILAWHRNNPDVDLHFFRDKTDESTSGDNTLHFYPLDDIAFLQQMAGCKAYASTAGFESICEAMYLGKPILMVPAHIEQECNAFDAMQNGAGIIDNDFNISKLLQFSQEYKPNTTFSQWVDSADCYIMDAIKQYKNKNYRQPTPPKIFTKKI